ncbi:MAG: hypothetical protein DPW09_06695 [Anaerolineae bacterium]|nr:hypothetical protein [Anaerolineales bacterium]MCQ3973123.1 hypothetical protein [Anaerolineae bacterium]
MRKSQIGLVAVISTFLTLLIISGSLLIFSQVSAAPSAAPLAQTNASLSYTSVSALAFGPVSQFAVYYKDFNQQLLTLGNQPRNFTGDSNRFIASLTLADQTVLSGLTVFGQDFDPQGEIRLRFKRCDHNQPRCVILAENASTVEYDGGLFEKVSLFNEPVDNAFYDYFLELELTALGNSGLRSVRLETTSAGTGSPPPANLQKWSLSGETTSFRLPNQTTTQARICTDDFGHLDNPTHYPILVVDGQVINLASNTCILVWGYSIELRRNYNTGPSSGTYQFLR